MTNKSIVFIAFVILFSQNCISQSINKKTENSFSLGGGFTYSIHNFMKKNAANRPVLPLEDSPYFESFGQSLFFSQSFEKLFYSLSVERAYGKRKTATEVENGTTLHIRYSKFEGTLNHGGPHHRRKRISGSFGYGIGMIYGNIRSSWISALDLTQGYEARVFDYGINTNIQTNYHLKRMTFYLKAKSSFFFKNQIAGFNFNLGVFHFF